MRYKYRGNKKDHNWFRAKWDYNMDQHNKKSAKGKLKILDSMYSEDQTWGALEKAWFAYWLNDTMCITDRARYYAAVIQKLQNELGLPIKRFPHLNMEAAGFFENNAYYMSGEYTGDELEEMKHNDIENLNRLREKAGEPPIDEAGEENYPKSLF